VFKREKPRLGVIQITDQHEEHARVIGQIVKCPVVSEGIPKTSDLVPQSINEFTRGGDSPIVLKDRRFKRVSFEQQLIGKLLMTERPRTVSSMTEPPNLGCG